MPCYHVTVTVDMTFEVNAETLEQALAATQIKLDATLQATGRAISHTTTQVFADWQNEDGEIEEYLNPA